MNNIEILEKLSDNEHSRWANWQKYVHSKCIKNKDGSLTIPKEYVDHWNYEINTEYKDLPENIKESDRKEARKILETLNYKNLLQENKELKEKAYKKEYYEEVADVLYKDSIPKLKVKEKIEETNNEKLNYNEDDYWFEQEVKGYAIDKLQELLEGGE